MQYLWVCRDKLNEWFQKNEITGNTTKTIYYGLVCFIHVEGDVNVFKIGCTTNLKTCLQDLQVCHYRLLQVHATIGNVPKKKRQNFIDSFKQSISEVNGLQVHLQ
jgi:hypothetical protein